MNAVVRITDYVVRLNGYSDLFANSGQHLLEIKFRDRSVDAVKDADCVYLI